MKPSPEQTRRIRLASSNHLSTQPRSDWQRLRYGLLVLAILVSFVTLQAAAVIEDHPHHHGGAHHHCCTACHSGLALILAATDRVNFAAPQVTAWHNPLETHAAKSSDIRGVQSSRAPPA